MLAIETSAFQTYFGGKMSVSRRFIHTNFLFKLAYRLWDSFCFEMFLIYMVDNLGYIWIILYIVDIF